MIKLNLDELQALADAASKGGCPRCARAERTGVGS